MKYISTRGHAPTLGFSDAVLAGLATDGGLYVPESWPVLSKAEWENMHGQSYSEVAYQIIQPFIGADIDEAALRSIIEDAYQTFEHQSVAPLIELKPGLFLMELFHGPTLAFKDVAMQLLSRIMAHILAEREQSLTIIGATSGDTGSAAIEAFRGLKNTEIFILHPQGRVSNVQRAQMTTVLDENVHNIAIKGTFDDCQAIVKELFSRPDLRSSVNLSGVNSVNWGRILAQIVYYVTSALSLGAPQRAVQFTVPTGNFGNIYAGFAAKKLGLPIQRLIIATNKNDILARTIKTKSYEKQSVSQTTSPSMDIQVSSNFERLLFEAYDRDPQAVTGLMQQLKQSGIYTLSDDAWETICQDFSAEYVDEPDVFSTIAEYGHRSDYVLDTHSAIGVNVADRLRDKTLPMVSLATAHPSKFPAAVGKALGTEISLHEKLAALMNKPERLKVLNNDVDEVKAYILNSSQFAKK